MVRTAALVLAAATLLVPRPTLASDSAGPIRIAVDASRASQKVLSAVLEIPVQPGPVTLLYPKWIPGEHGPTGPIVNSTGLVFSVGGRTVPWRRDSLDMFTFHVDVPPGATTLEAKLDYLSPVEGESGFSAGQTTSDQMAVVSWNTVLLYPAGVPASRLTYSATLKLPGGWKYGTALPVAAEAAGTITFAPASLETLIDSPVTTGAHFRQVPLTTSGAGPAVEMDIAADSEAALMMSPETRSHYERLVSEARALFGAEHYRDYHFLLSLSDHVAHFGLEHHESDDSRASERSLVDDHLRPLMAALLPHEYVHSWNGKYRRPAGLATPDYELPMQTDLLWVYEGLTEYLGDVLAARSGLWTPQEYRDYLAGVAASLDHRSGRTWRPLQDTATDAQILYGAPLEWSDWRRGTDFYQEGELVWLKADTLIRQETGGQRSLDDFCRLFYGPPSSGPQVRPYTFDDVVAGLTQVDGKQNWRAFLTERLQSTAPHAPLGGIRNSGWQLAYQASPTTLAASAAAVRGLIDARFSLGLLLRTSGEVIDTVFAQPGERAGIVPGMRIVAVNSRAFSPEVLREALAATTGQSAAHLELIVENAGYFSTRSVTYQGGERYPHLAREDGRADMLAEIIKPRAAQ